VFGCFTADAHGLKNLEAVGPKNICFEIDYPHSDTTWPTSKAYAENFVATQGLSEEVTYDVLRGNAIRMLSLDRT
jgi:predicted TIM-barrel fold metal-dependent hydrolase